MAEKTKKPDPQVLHRATERMSQIALAHAPAIVELARGAYQKPLEPQRPGLKPVGQLLTMLLVNDIKVKLLLAALVEAAVVTPEGFEADLAVALEIEAKGLAEEINHGDLGLLHNFAFQPVAELVAPKEKA